HVYCRVTDRLGCKQCRHGTIWLIALLFASSLMMSSVPVWAQAGFNVCIEDGGRAECMDGQRGPYRYIIRNPFALGTYSSEQDVYSRISTYDNGYCTSQTEPPPYTWSFSSGYFSSVDWETTIVETGITGHCDGGPLSPLNINWHVGRIM